MTGSDRPARTRPWPIVRFIALAALILLPGCMSLAGRDYQVVPIESDPPGAEAVSVEGERCTTPCELRLPKMRLQAVWVEKPGFEPVEVALGTRTWRGGVAASITGNLLLGAAITTAGVAYALTTADWNSDDPWAGMWVGGAGVVIALGGGALTDFSDGAHRRIEPKRVRVVLVPAARSREPSPHIPGFGPSPNRY